MTTRASLHFPDEPQPTRRGVKRESQREDLVIEEQSVGLGLYTRDFGVRVWGQGVGFGV